MLLVGPAGSTVKISTVSVKRVAFKAFQEFKLFLIFVKRQSSICQLTSVFNRETISLRGLVIVELMKTSHKLASHADVLRLVTRSSPRTSAQRTGHIRSLAVSQS